MTHLRLRETPKLGVHQTGSSSEGQSLRMVDTPSLAPALSRDRLGPLNSQQDSRPSERDNVSLEGAESAFAVFLRLNSRRRSCMLQERTLCCAPPACRS